MERRTTESGEAVYVAEGEERVGSEGPFLVVYSDAEREERYGYLCSSCGTIDNAMDTMGRIVCNECGNTRKPEEWDAAHE
jgi:peptide subunit release factor 1 (eRF1)